MAFRVGVYRWSYKSGAFDVSFRANGVFQCAKYPGEASWAVNGANLLVNWKGYGVYEFPLTGTAALDGYAQGNTSNWRKIEFLRDFNATERLIFGDGYGTAWNFIYEKGSFEVEFRADSFNHFVCPQYPAHSHWSIDDSELVYVNWGKYGEYELRLSGNPNELVGSKKGQPANWRKAVLLRNLGVESLASLPAHDHSHEHVHTSDCKH